MTVSLIDIYPTLVETCNLPAPRQELEGVSLASTLKNPSDAKDRTVYLPYMNPGEYTLMNRDWRFIHYDDKNQELYNVKEDPHEWGQPRIRSAVQRCHRPTAGISTDGVRRSGTQTQREA